MRAKWFSFLEIISKHIIRHLVDSFSLVYLIIFDSGDKEMVDMMLKHGADLSLTDYKGHFAIMPCLENGLSISLLRYIVNMMDEQEIKYSLHISSWDYLKEAFSWPRFVRNITITSSNHV